jgi:hypothetical protein
LGLLHKTLRIHPAPISARAPQPVLAGFNRLLQVESRAYRLAGNAGATALRGVPERGGIIWPVMSPRPALPWQVADRLFVPDQRRMTPPHTGKAVVLNTVRSANEECI